jgi:hypothetical protein
MVAVRPGACRDELHDRGRPGRAGPVACRAHPGVVVAIGTVVPGVLVIGLAGRVATSAGLDRRDGHTRGRTVIVQQPGRGGQAMRIEAGSGSNDSADQSGPGCGRRWPTASLLRVHIDTPLSAADQPEAHPNSAPHSAPSNSTSTSVSPTPGCPWQFEKLRSTVEVTEP